MDSRSPRPPLAPAPNRKWRPSGKNQGYRWVFRLPSSSFVAGVGAPPEAVTRMRAPVDSGANTMTPPAPQEPPRNPGASASVYGVPPARSILCSSPPSVKPMLRLSGDQNSGVPPSVPGSACDASVSSVRTQIWDLLSAAVALKAMRLPFGETKAGVVESAVFSGVPIVKRITGSSAGFWRK